LGLLPRLRLNWSHPGVRRMLKLMAPAAFGVSISQVSLLINTIFASFLVSGSVSWLYYADRLMEFPAGVLGVALGSILLPSLSKYHADARHAEYGGLLDWGLRLAFLLAVPSAVALAVLALPLVATLFHYGRFAAEDAWMTRQALVAYSVGLLGMILVKIAAAAACMALALFATTGESGWWLSAPWQQKLPAIIGLVLLGGAAYAGCLLAFGMRPRDFSRRGAA